MSNVESQKVLVSAILEEVWNGGEVVTEKGGLGFYHGLQSIS